MRPILWSWFYLDDLLVEVYRHGKRMVELARPLWTPEPQIGRHRAPGRAWAHYGTGEHRPAPGAGASLLGRVRALWDGRVDRQVDELIGHLEGVEYDPTPLQPTGWASRAYNRLKALRPTMAVKRDWSARRRPVIVTKNPGWDDEPGNDWT